MTAIATIRFGGPGPYGTSVFVNNSAGYAAATTSALAVDDTARGTAEVRTLIKVGQDVWAQNTAVAGNPIQFLGIATAVGSATAITFNDGTGLRFALVDNQELFVADPSWMAYGLALQSGFTAADADDKVNVCWSPRNEICYTFFAGA